MERKHWSKDEDLALTQLVEELGSSSWTLLSVRMVQKYPQYSRTGKQCRERWYNYLSKSSNKAEWLPAQEELLFTLHQNFGNKWKEISKNMTNRTEPEIKNHLYASLRKGVRRMNKFLNTKVDANILRSIRPCILTDICLEDDCVEILGEKISVSEIMKKISILPPEESIKYLDIPQFKKNLLYIFNKIMNKDQRKKSIRSDKRLCESETEKSLKSSEEYTEISKATVTFESKQSLIEEEESLDIMKWLDLGRKKSSLIIENPVQIDNFLVFGKDLIQQSVFFEI